MSIRFRHITLRMGSIFLLLVMLLVPTINTKSYADNDLSENDIKALFILNFIKYINWPPEIDKSAIRIGIAGDSPVLESLLKVIRNRRENKNIKVEKLDPNAGTIYQIIFVTSEESSKIMRWNKKYAGKGVLIISDGCKSNCVASINLINIDNKMRFEINTFAAEACGIKISTRLMELATSVE
jgi:hypothetical protein